MIVANFQVFGDCFITLIDMPICQAHIEKLELIGNTSSQAYHNLIVQLEKLGYKVIRELELKHYCFMSYAKDYNKISTALTTIKNFNLDRRSLNGNKEENHLSERKKRGINPADNKDLCRPPFKA